MAVVDPYDRQADPAAASAAAVPAHAAGPTQAAAGGDVMSGVNMVEAVDEADHLSDMATLMYIATLGLAQYANSFSVGPEVCEAMEFGARQVRDRAKRLKLKLAGEATGDPAD